VLFQVSVLLPLRMISKRSAALLVFSRSGRTFPQILDGAVYTTDLVVFGGAGSGTLEVDAQ
jgi:hypothetical protein